MRFIKGISCFNYIFDAFFINLVLKCFWFQNFERILKALSVPYVIEIVINFVGKTNQTNQLCFCLLRKKNVLSSMFIAALYFLSFVQLVFSISLSVTKHLNMHLESSVLSAVLKPLLLNVRLYLEFLYLSDRHNT